MNEESYNPFSLEIPEKTINSIWLKSLAVLLVGIFVTIPLAEIDSSTFYYNEVFMSFGHQDCSHLECILISFL